MFVDWASLPVWNWYPLSRIGMHLGGEVKEVGWNNKVNSTSPRCPQSKVIYFPPRRKLLFFGSHPSDAFVGGSEKSNHLLPCECQDWRFLEQCK